MSDAVKRFNKAVQEQVEGGLSQKRAVAAVAKGNPALHTRYLLATNPGAGAQRQIMDTFEDSQRR